MRCTDFIICLEVIVKKEKPTHALVAFDAGKTTFRHEFFEDYKGGRSNMPAEFAEQIPLYQRFVRRFWFANLSIS